MPLTTRQEAFCQSYAASPNGAAAARDAGYSGHSAARYASHLIRVPAVAARIAELGAPALENRAALTAERDAAARALSDKLAPIYEANLRDGDYDGAMQAIELQGRIERHLGGGSTIKARGPRPPAVEDRSGVNEQTLNRLDKLTDLHDVNLEAVFRALERIEAFLDPAGEHNLLRRYHRDGAADPYWYERPNDEVDSDGYLDLKEMDTESP